MINPAKNRKIAIALAFAGSPLSPLPLAWLHKFYLGEYLWGIVYLVLAPTALPKVACCLEGFWYLTQSDEEFAGRFPKAGALLSSVNTSATAPTNSSANKLKTETDQHLPVQNVKAQTAQQVAVALRDLDQLRQDGLITEYEFEQKRRNLLSEIS